MGVRPRATGYGERRLWMAARAEVSTLDVIRPVLPAGGDVHSMLDTRECLNNQSWSDQLNPLWLTSSIEKYGGWPTDNHQGLLP